MTTQTITIRVKFFASLRETLGTAQVNLTVPNECTVEMLLKNIQETYGLSNPLFDTRDLRVAVNQQLVELDQVVRIDDEVAIFPPITGG